MQEQLSVEGKFTLEVIRDGKIIDSTEIPNTVTIEGRNHLLDVGFMGATQITDWYVGLVINGGFVSFQATDTYVTNGFTEFTDYTDTANGGSATTRPEWVPAAAAAGSTTTGTVATFDVTVGNDIVGLMIVGGTSGADTKGNTDAGNVLWSGATLDGGVKTVAVNDQLRVTYTIST